MDALHEALRALGGDGVEFVIPLAVGAGSVQSKLRLPQTQRRSLERLRTGPNRSWTPAEHRGTNRFYGYLRERNIVALCGERKLKPVHVPSSTQSGIAREVTSAVGRIEQAGGLEGRVRVMFEAWGRVHCDAGQQLAKQLGGRLYERLLLHGVRESEPESGTILRFTIRTFEPIADFDSTRGPFVRQVAELLADHIAPYEEMMEDLRP